MLEKKVFVSHPDVELGIERKPVEYFITFPEQGINEDTGLIFSIGGYGETADSEYRLHKLTPYLANDANCLVVGLNYHGIHRSGPNKIDGTWISYAQAIYGYKEIRPQADMETRFHDFLNWVWSKGIRVLDARFTEVFYIEYPEYHSFGFLPALDHLAVLKEIITTYKINSRRIIAYGTSYGGYIAQLLAKFAPNTFAVVIDNSGFSRTHLPDVVGRDFIKFGQAMRFGSNGELTVYFSSNYPWTVYDDRSPYYFSDACRSIRSLLIDKHYGQSETRYYITHSTGDQLAPIAEKDQVVEYLRENHQVFYKRVTIQDLDGKVFKKLDHGMDASLMGIYDLIKSEGEQTFCKSSAENDFSTNQVHTFNCGAKNYVFSYQDDYSFNVSIEDR